MVLDDAVEEKPGGERVRLGMVVIRGNSVVMLEVREEDRSIQFLLRHELQLLISLDYRHLNVLAAIATEDRLSIFPASERGIEIKTEAGVYRDHFAASVSETMKRWAIDLWDLALHYHSSPASPPFTG